MKVLDTSAVIAFFLDESGAEIVRRACDAGMMSYLHFYFWFTFNNASTNSFTRMGLVM